MRDDGVDAETSGPPARLAVPAGWERLEPVTDEAEASASERIAVADWDSSRGTRPTVTATVTPAPAGPADEPVALRVLAEAQAHLEDVHVLSIDPWAMTGESALGRRLVFSHRDGDRSLTTMTWCVSTAGGDVVVTASTESLGLHEHARSFAEAVAGVRLPGVPSRAPAPSYADLARRVPSAPWADVAPRSRRRGPMITNPDSRILVEASLGQTSLHFDATIAGDEVTVAATPSPRAPLAADGLSVFRIPVGRLSTAVARWLGLGPASNATTTPTEVPISLVMRRLAEPATPRLPGIDATTWQQPWFLWTLRSSATDSGLVMIDAGTSGQCAIMETDDERSTRFAPLSTYDVWLTLNWLVSESLVG